MSRHDEECVKIVSGSGRVAEIYEEMRHVCCLLCNST